MREPVIDRTGWPEGPWIGEPDRVQWRTCAGLPGLIVRNRLGGLCGYAAVAPGHPAYGQPYDDVDVAVHGGLTYAGACQEDGPICHVPDVGEPDDVWWLGFDCGHVGDVLPRMLALNGPDPILGETYKDLPYVTGEVEELARQLSVMGT